MAQAREKRLDFIGLVETQLVGEKILSFRKHADRAGYTLYFAPAVVTAEGGTSGGAAILVAKHLTSSNYYSSGGKELQQIGFGKRWLFVRLRTGGGTFSFGVAYFVGGIKATGENLALIGKLVLF